MTVSSRGEPCSCLASANPSRHQESKLPCCRPRETIHRVCGRMGLSSALRRPFARRPWGLCSPHVDIHSCLVLSVREPIPQSPQAAKDWLGLPCTEATVPGLGAQELDTSSPGFADRG